MIFTILLLSTLNASGASFVVGNGQQYFFKPEETRSVCAVRFDGDLKIQIQNGSAFRLLMELNDVDVTESEWQTEFIPWRSKIDFTVFDGGPNWRSDNSSCLPISFKRTGQTLDFEFSCQRLKYSDLVNPPRAIGILSGKLSCELRFFQPPTN